MKKIEVDNLKETQEDIKEAREYLDGYAENPRVLDTFRKVKEPHARDLKYAAVEHEDGKVKIDNLKEMQEVRNRFEKTIRLVVAEGCFTNKHYPLN